MTAPAVVVLNIDPSVFYGVVFSAGTAVVIAFFKNLRKIIKAFVDFAIFARGERSRLRWSFHQMGEADRQLRAP